MAVANGFTNGNGYPNPMSAGSTYTDMSCATSPQMTNGHQSPTQYSDYPQSSYLPPIDSIPTAQQNIYQAMQPLPDLGGVDDVSCTPSSLLINFRVVVLFCEPIIFAFYPLKISWVTCWSIPPVPFPKFNQLDNVHVFMFYQSYSRYIKKVLRLDGGDPSAIISTGLSGVSLEDSATGGLIAADPFLANHMPMHGGMNGGYDPGSMSSSNGSGGGSMGNSALNGGQYNSEYPGMLIMCKCITGLWSHFAIQKLSWLAWVLPWFHELSIFMDGILCNSSLLKIGSLFESTDDLSSPVFLTSNINLCKLVMRKTVIIFHSSWIGKYFVYGSIVKLESILDRWDKTEQYIRIATIRRSIHVLFISFHYIQS